MIIWDNEYNITNSIRTSETQRSHTEDSTSTTIQCYMKCHMNCYMHEVLHEVPHEVLHKVPHEVPVIPMDAEPLPLEIDDTSTSEKLSFPYKFLQFQNAPYT